MENLQVRIEIRGLARNFLKPTADVSELRRKPKSFFSKLWCILCLRYPIESTYCLNPLEHFQSTYMYIVDMVHNCNVLCKLQYQVLLTVHLVYLVKIFGFKPKERNTIRLLLNKPVKNGSYDKRASQDFYVTPQVTFFSLCRVSDPWGASMARIGLVQQAMRVIPLARLE